MPTARPPSISPARRCFACSRCSRAFGGCVLSMPETRTIDADDDGIRLDRWFKRHFPYVTHVLLQKLLRKGEVRLDGRRPDPATRILAGQSVRLPPQVVHAKDARPQKAEPEPKHPL